MTEEPYRWLEAVANRREYVLEQLKGGSPVFGASLPEGILMLGVGTGQSKVFEVFDRQAVAGLGHPADMEKVRQALIDVAHLEAFTRSPEDVSLRRLISFGLSPQLKANFEQIFSAPGLVELLLAELGPTREKDHFFRLHFDGSFEVQTGGIAVAAHSRETEAEIKSWLTKETPGKSRKEVAELFLQAWWLVMAHKKTGEKMPEVSERQEGWRKNITDKVIEIGWLARDHSRAARYQNLSLEQLE